MAYPLLAFVFIAITYATVNSLVVAYWHQLTAQTVIGDNQLVSTINSDKTFPHELRTALGIVTFYYFYTAVVTAYFTCAAAAAVWAKLEGHPTTVLHGLAIVGKHFWRVSKFAALSIFFIPLGIIAQREKLPRGIIGVLGSSLTLHTANLAPAILEGHKGVNATIRETVNTMGGAWREGLIIKLGMWSALIFLSFISFLPKLIQYWSDSQTAHWVGWFMGVVLFGTFFVTTKVLGGVLLTTLYHNVKKHPEQYK